MKKPSKKYLREKSWEEKAQENPLYGVMSHEEFANSGAQPTEDELNAFYSRGEEMVSRWINPWLLETLTSTEMNILEFGCGMGRLTNSVAKNRKTENVYGIDISKTMIAHAKAHTADGTQYAVVDEMGSFPYENEKFDRIYSYAVFQHISKKSVVEKSIVEIARVLKPGGYVRLNFEMIFPPPFQNPLKQDTTAFEDKYVVHGWKKFGGVPLWGLSINQPNNWSGTRLGYKQLIAKFRECGIDVYGITHEPNAKGMVWFFGKKAE